MDLTGISCWTCSGQATHFESSGQAFCDDHCTSGAEDAMTTKMQMDTGKKGSWAHTRGESGMSPPDLRERPDGSRSKEALEEKVAEAIDLVFIVRKRVLPPHVIREAARAALGVVEAERATQAAEVAALLTKERIEQIATGALFRAADEGYTFKPRDLASFVADDLLAALRLFLTEEPR